MNPQQSICVIQFVYLQRPLAFKEFKTYEGDKYVLNDLNGGPYPEQPR